MPTTWTQLTALGKGITWNEIGEIWSQAVYIWDSLALTVWTSQSKSTTPTWASQGKSTSPTWTYQTKN